MNTDYLTDLNPQDKPLIIKPVYGGLGNQLLQYAAGYALAKKNNARLALHPNAEYFALDERWNTNSVYCWQLPYFKAPFTYASIEEVYRLDPTQDRETVIKQRRTLQGRLKRLIVPKRFRLEGQTPKTVYEHPRANTAHVPDYLDRQGDCYLKGAFISHKNFTHVREDLLQLFQLRHDMTVGSQKVSDEINACALPVSIHFRRGDYVSEASNAKVIDGIATLAYYHNAIRLIQEALGTDKTPHLFIFSDDIPWVREHFKTELFITYVDHSSYLIAYEDIMNMAQCHHHILPGYSSFSFWGAYLCQHPEQIVVRPHRADNLPELDHPDDFFPPEWLKAESE